MSSDEDAPPVRPVYPSILLPTVILAARVLFPIVLLAGLVYVALEQQKQTDAVGDLAKGVNHQTREVTKLISTQESVQISDAHPANSQVDPIPMGTKDPLPPETPPAVNPPQKLEQAADNVPSQPAPIDWNQVLKPLHEAIERESKNVAGIYDESKKKPPTGMSKEEKELIQNLVGVLTKPPAQPAPSTEALRTRIMQMLVSMNQSQPAADQDKFKSSLENFNKFFRDEPVKDAPPESKSEKVVRQVQQLYEATTGPEHNLVATMDSLHKMVDGLYKPQAMVLICNNTSNLPFLSYQIAVNNFLKEFPESDTRTVSVLENGKTVSVLKNAQDPNEAVQAREKTEAVVWDREEMQASKLRPEKLQGDPLKIVLVVPLVRKSDVASEQPEILQFHSSWKEKNIRVHVIAMWNNDPDAENMPQEQLKLAVKRLDNWSKMCREHNGLLHLVMFTTTPPTQDQPDALKLPNPIQANVTRILREIAQ
ncbi:hypothetical protein [Blastopirellula marina]|uniref:hypothetical protein n=1 Tax=Blastopirellula marina TaxID=124 RepID=UPI0011B03474|nr:hypothetical protein [Blastopirellula marina]